MKRWIVIMLTGALAFGMLSGCGAKVGDSASDSVQSETPEIDDDDDADETDDAEDNDSDDNDADDNDADDRDDDDEENYDTGDASLDDPRNQDEIGEKEILVVSFGTSYNDSRRLTIGAIEQAIEDANPDWSVRRAFTSQIIIDHIKDRDGVEIDNVKEALERAVKNGVKELLVQPTHLMDGLEYNDLIEEVGSYSDAFEKVYVGEPLLTSDDDFQRVANAIVNATAQYSNDKTAIVFMGHGTEAESNGVYDKLQKLLTSMDRTNYFIGTVEATPTIEDVMAAVGKGNPRTGESYEKVVLMPLMVVAGDHANNDMAGDDDDSWKSLFEKAGYEVEVVLSGLGEIQEIRQVYTEHASAAKNN